jgi:hypothetical protein
MRRIALVALVAILVAAIGGAVAWRGRTRRSNDPASPDVRAPDGVRVRVGVLNGTKTRGLARRATMLLRDRGFDVLEMGTESRPQDTTVVYDLLGHPDWAQRVARTFSPARVEARRDTSRYLDVIVVLGTTWRAPAQPFYP